MLYYKGKIRQCAIQTPHYLRRVRVFTHMAKRVWYGHAKKYVTVDDSQYHTRVCKPGRYEIDEPRADPLNLDDPDPECVVPLDVALEHGLQELSDRILDCEDQDEANWLEEALGGLQIFDIATPGVAQYLGLTGIPRRKRHSATA